jgi:hypothetical protein
VEVLINQLKCGTETQDYDIKMDMKKESILTQMLSAQIDSVEAQLLATIQNGALLTISGIKFEWRTRPQRGVFSLMAFLKIPEFTKATGMETYNFAIVDLTPPTGMQLSSDRLPNGVYYGTPEYILCKSWGQAYKAKRRRAKLKYWNTPVDIAYTKPKIMIVRPNEDIQCF